MPWSSKLLGMYWAHFPVEGSVPNLFVIRVKERNAISTLLIQCPICQLISLSSGCWTKWHSVTNQYKKMGHLTPFVVITIFVISHKTESNISSFSIFWARGISAFDTYIETSAFCHLLNLKGLQVGKPFICKEIAGKYSGSTIFWWWTPILISCWSFTRATVLHM